MAKIRQCTVVGVSALAALTMVASSASAATTTIRRGTAAGAAYAGKVQASLLGTATVSTSLGSGSCSSSVMRGTVASNGTALAITSATFNNGGTTPCTGAPTATITALSLPWSGGNVTYAPASGGRDATITIANFKVSAAVTVLGIPATCVFGGSLIANGYNPTNAARPNTAAEAQAYVNGATVNKVSSGSSIACPSTAKVTAIYKLQGETVANSGVYNQTLFITS